MKDYKTIRDSVHGAIQIKMPYVTKLLDSPFMQRLRRIEQSSIRSLYPCARHDRFTHSLGVFHVGMLIAQNIENDYIEDSSIQNIVTQIKPSYEMACLMHDIGHAPFSHSFEEYYGRKDDLYEKLRNAVNDQLPPAVDLSRIKHHELVSAYVVAKKFKNEVADLQGNVELICRMIIGVKYPEDTDEHQIKNRFIELLNGEIIDADKIDYACRDVWASGYSAAQIDIQRITKAIHIKKNSDNFYAICIDHNALTDLQNVLDVKKFQNRYVLTHHSVVYEQVLLEQAALKMAEHLYSNNPNLKPEEALGRIVSTVAICDTKKVPVHPAHGKGEYSFKHLCDDDLFFLIQQDEDNTFYQELTSRQYKKFALWKNPSEFYRMFPKLDKKFNIDLVKHKKRIISALKGKGILQEEDIVMKEVKYNSPQSIADLHIIINDEVKVFNQTCAPYYIDTPIATNKKQIFTYVFISKKLKNRVEDIVREITPIMEELFT